MRTPQRRCVACREGGGRDELLRFVVSPDGELVVDVKASLPGRGAWFHPRRACLDRLVAKPSMLKRALKVDSINTGPGLCQVVQAAVLRGLSSGLSIAAASGGLVGGHDRLVDALKRGEINVVALADGASARTLASIRLAADGAAVRCVPIPLDPCALGALTGRPKLAAVGVLPQGPTKLLRRNLARLTALS